MNLNQITVPSLDLAKSVPFYQKLGLTLIVNSHSQYARFECPYGESTFSIHKTSGGAATFPLLAPSSIWYWP